MNTLKSTITVLAFVASLYASAQAVRYSYDAAGNRVRREIVINQQNAPQHEAPPAYYTESLSDDYRIKIHPNSQNGTIRVEVIAATGSKEGSVAAYSLSGAKVGLFPVENGNAYVDLSDAPNGVYILHIDVNGNTTDWKIIKR